METKNLPKIGAASHVADFCILSCQRQNEVLTASLKPAESIVKEAEKTPNDSEKKEESKFIYSRYFGYLLLWQLQ